MRACCFLPDHLLELVAAGRRMALKVIVKVPEDQRNLFGEFFEGVRPLLKLNSSIDLHAAIVGKLARA